MTDLQWDDFADGLLLRTLDQIRVAHIEHGEPMPARWERAFDRVIEGMADRQSARMNDRDS